MDACTHLELIQAVTPSAQGCEDCLKMGDSWVHLRICLVCGHVGCCNASRNRHAKKHFEETGHQLVQSFEPGQDWIWCFEDRAYVIPPPAGVPSYGYEKGGDESSNSIIE